MSPRRAGKGAPKDRAERRSAAESLAAALEEFFFAPDEVHPDVAVLAEAPAATEAGEAELVTGGEGEYLAFALGDELYALPIVALREIVRPLPITDVPRTPSWVLGVITLRGTVLPVFDLRLRIGLTVGEPGRGTRILVVETEEGPAGLLTDRVEGVVRDEAGELEPPPQALGGGSEFIEGLLRREGRMIIVLSYEAALRIPESERPRRSA